MSLGISVEIKNVEQVARQWDEWMAAVEQEVADVANGITVELFNKILEFSPQFSGDFVGNWKYSINKVDVSFESLPFLDAQPAGRLEPFHCGSMPAIIYARQMNKGKDHGYKLGDTFYLSTSAEHDDAYAPMIEEEGRIKFRPDTGNAAKPVERAIVAVMPQYTTITRQQAQRLKKEKL